MAVCKLGRAITLKEVIEGMKVTGIVNATLQFHLPGSVSFENCKIVPLSE
jgi:hypothetical protein